MFVSYLIDPLERSVTKVSNGFDRAPALLDTECLEMTNLWTDMADDESTVDMVTAEEDLLEPPEAYATFAFTLKLGLESLRRHFCGKGILVVCGNVRADLAEQVATIDNVQSAVEFLQTKTVQEPVVNTQRGTVFHWNRHSRFARERAAARRAVSTELSKHRSTKKS
ncbi:MULTISPECIES: hypothetical protein [Caballeronia]|uniref:hypothetical protein n=1 Tax=Caballeronia TaxID=1827195 RepID=UPI001FD24418|nr:MULTISPECIES: hypothetical protein [Caballeronia]MDR5799004.1 hypothetical protein [Caballeronia sp. LZ001]